MEEKAETDVIYQVYRSVWFLGLWMGTKLVCYCDNVINGEKVVICSSKGNVVAVIDIEQFAYAIGTIQ